MDEYDHSSEICLDLQEGLIALRVLSAIACWYAMPLGTEVREGRSLMHGVRSESVNGPQAATMGGWW